MLGHNQPPLAERLEIEHASLQQQVAEALAMEELPPIFTDDDLPPYTERAKALKGIAAMVEKTRKAEKDEFLKGGQTVDEFFKNMAAPVLVAVQAVVDAIHAHQKKMLAERRAAEEAARKEAEAKAKAESTPFDDPEPVAQVIPLKTAEATRVVSASGRVTATASTVWKYTVTDPSAVPRQYLTVNDAAVKAAIAGGVREIAGLNIHEELRTSIR